MDSQFLMQRYWGSEDEDEDPSQENNHDSNQVQCYNSSKVGVSSFKHLSKSTPVSENKKVKHKVKRENAESTQIQCIELDNSSEVDDVIFLQDSKKSADQNGDLKINDKPKRSRKSNKSDNVKKINSSSSDLQNLIKQNETVTKNDFQDSKDLALELGVFQPLGKIALPDKSKIQHNIPNWLSNPTFIEVDLSKEEKSLSELNYLDSNSKNNLMEAGISYLFPVQLAVIPWLLQSKEQSLLIRPSDICVSAPTGSGKTLAFVLPIVQSLKDRIVCSIRALVVLPVNELAIQVYKVFETFVRGTDLKVALLTGQKSFVQEQNILIKHTGNKVQSLIDIVVTSPGRVSDHILRTKGFCLKSLRYLVIDEADRMMEEIQQGWLKQVEEAVFQDSHFVGCICNNVKRQSIEPTSAYNFGIVCQPLQKLLFSATLTHNPEQLHSLALYKPKLFTTSLPNLKDPAVGQCVLPQNLKMMQVICNTATKPMVICHIMKKFGFKKVLCFTESVERAHRLHLVLEKMKKFEVREMSSFNRAVQRKIVFEQFSSGKVNLLVCSDLVARGIDVEDIDCVISYDVPQFVKNYVHRIGRTARAGKSGTAITLLSEGQVHHFSKLLESAKIDLPEVFVVGSEDLKPLVHSYQKALVSADAKLRLESSNPSGKPQKKRKQKKKLPQSLESSKVSDTLPKKGKKRKFHDVKN